MFSDLVVPNGSEKQSIEHNVPKARKLGPQARELHQGPLEALEPSMPK